MMKTPKAFPRTGPAGRPLLGILEYCFTSLLVCVLCTLLMMKAAYIHIVIACSILTIGGVYASSRYWHPWAKETRIRLEAAQLTASQIRHTLIVGRYKVRFGILTIALLLIFSDSWGDGVTTIVFENNWWLLRIPILTGLAGALACYDCVFRLCSHNSDCR
jgi:hypothetical protein